MASRRRRTMPLPSRVSRVQRPLSIGDSSTSGRRARVPASRNPLLLPRSMAVAFPGRVQDLAYRSSRVRVYRSPPGRSQGRRPDNLLLQQIAWLKARRSSRVARAELIRPSLNPRTTLCQKRHIRKSVLFSLNVAGKGWGSGGPNMRRARRTPSSQFSC